MAEQQERPRKTGDYDQTIVDHRRGCKYLKPDSTYLHADVTAFAGPNAPPAWITFDPPIPYKEGHFRTYKRINGTELLLEAARGEGKITSEYPEDEVLSHVSRVGERHPDGSHVGAIKSHLAFDLLMHVGSSYYPEPGDFIEEACAMGINKRIPVSGSQEPPRILPTRTRLFLVHPSAIPTGKSPKGEDLDIDPNDDEKADPDDQEYLPGIIGYGYLTRTIHTKPYPAAWEYDCEHDHKGEYDRDEYPTHCPTCGADRVSHGEVPDWVADYADRDLLDVVDVEPGVTLEDPDHPVNRLREQKADREDGPSETAVDVDEYEESESDGDEDEAVDESDEADDPEGRPEWLPEPPAGKVGEVMRTIESDAESEGVSLYDVYRDELVGVSYNDLRKWSSLFDLGEFTGSTPKGDALRDILTYAAIVQGVVGDDDYYVVVNGDAHSVDELSDAPQSLKVERAVVKQRITEAINNE